MAGYDPHDREHLTAKLIGLARSGLDAGNMSSRAARAREAADELYLLGVADGLQQDTITMQPAPPMRIGDGRNLPSDRKCPDDGACHHGCTQGCFRVAWAGPLSGVFPGDTWPAEIVAEHGTQDGVL